MKKNLLTASLALGVSSFALSAYAANCEGFVGASLSNGICTISEDGGASRINRINDIFSGSSASQHEFMLQALPPSGVRFQGVSGGDDTGTSIDDSKHLIINSTSALDFVNNGNITNNSMLIDTTNLDGLEFYVDAKFYEGNDTVNIIGNNTSDVLIGSSIDLGAGTNTVTATNGSVFSASSQIIGGSGIDTFTFETGVKVDGVINAGDGADVFNFTDAFIGGTVNGEAGQDKFTLSNTEVTGDIDAGDDNDELSILDSSVSGNVAGGVGGDNFIVDNSTITGLLDGGAGNDIFSISASVISGDITGGAGNDYVDLRRSKLEGKIDTADGIDVLDIADVTSTAASIIETGLGDDGITVTGTSSLGTISMGDGSDDLLLKGANITLLNTLDGGDDTQEADGWIDTLTFDGWGAADWPTVGLTNWEYIVLKASEFTATGNPTIDTGNLVVEGDGKLNIPDGAKLTGNLDNKGVVDVSNGTAGDAILDIAGNYKGTGDVILDLDLGQEKSDVVKIGGQVEDPINLDFNRVGGDHAGGGSAGILVVDAPNATPSDINFDATVGGSAFAWDLEGRDGQFYLGYVVDPENPVTPVDPTDPITPVDPTNPVIPTIPVTPVLPELAGYATLPYIGRDLSLSHITTLHDRLGELRRINSWVGTGPQTLRTKMGSEWGNVYDYIPNDKNVWAKGVIGGANVGSGENNYGYDGLYGGIDAGFDYQYARDRHNVYYGGLFLGYRMGNMETDGTLGNINGITTADIDLNSYSIGAYGTYFMNNKSFIDLVAKYTLFDGNVSYGDTAISETTTLAAYNNDVGGSSWSLSGEFGHRVDLDEDLILEPQAQLVYNRMSWDDNNRSGLYESSIGNSDFITARLGLRLEKTYELSKERELKPWLRVNALQEFGSGGELNIKDSSGSYVVEGYDLSTYGQFDLGVTYKAKDSIQLYGSANYRDDFSDYQSYEGAVGLRVSW